MARRYEFSAHAQVLVRYSGFDGGACVVPPLEARLAATLPDARGMVVDDPRRICFAERGCFLFSLNWW